MINNLLLIALILALPSCGWGKKEKKDEQMETQLFHDRYDDEDRTRITGRRKHPLTGRSREEHYREEEERPARGTKRYREERARTLEEKGDRDRNRGRLTGRRKLIRRDNDDDVRRGHITGREKFIQ